VASETRRQLVFTLFDAHVFGDRSLQASGSGGTDYVCSVGYCCSGCRRDSYFRSAFRACNIRASDDACINGVVGETTKSGFSGAIRHRFFRIADTEEVLSVERIRRRVGHFEHFSLQVVYHAPEREVAFIACGSRTMSGRSADCMKGIA